MLNKLQTIERKYIQTDMTPKSWTEDKQGSLYEVQQGREKKDGRVHNKQDGIFLLHIEESDMVWKR